MKEKPILFSCEMVLAILAGRKTQTRRIVNFRDGTPGNEITLTRYQDGYPEGIRPVFGTADEPNAFSVKCPYLCDRLWVRERLYFDADAGWKYWADETLVPEEADFAKKTPSCPSIHMPRAACRLLLDVKRVWVERVQDISEEDALAEGIETGGVASFRTLWDSINGEPRRAGADISWAANPWVWCVEFAKED